MCGLTLLLGAALLGGGADDAPRSRTAAALISGEDVIPEYVGSRKCGTCHAEQYASWKRLSKGRSWEALKVGVNPAVKARAGLDAGKDYTTDRRCLVCHAVGYDRPGGYAAPDPDDAKSKKQAAAREGAGCEACHGPGGDFVLIMEQIFRGDRLYEPEVLYSAGLQRIGPNVCKNCHNEAALCVRGSADGEEADSNDPRCRMEPSDRRGYHAEFPRRLHANPRRSTQSGEPDEPPKTD